MMAKEYRGGAVLIAILRCAIVCVVMAVATSAWALRPNDHVTQYGHRVWRVGDSGLEHEPTAVAQTTDGQLWVGTTAGIYRFDGERFAHWPSSGKSDSDLDDIYDLMGAGSDSLYVSSTSSLARIDGDSKYRYASPLGLYNAFFVKDARGVVWLGQSAASQNARLCAIGREGLKCFGQRDGLSCSHNESIAVGPDADIWLGGTTGVCRWRLGGAGRVYPLGDITAPVTALAVDGHGTVWAGVSSGDHSTGLWSLEGSMWRHFNALDGKAKHLNVHELLVDRNGCIWIGTYGLGLFRIINGVVEHFDHVDGLSSDQVNYIFEDREGSIWVATTHGIDQFIDQPVIPFTAREGLSDSGRHWLTSGPAGAILVGGNNGENVIDSISADGRISTLTRLPARTYAGEIFSDSEGRLWRERGSEVILAQGNTTRTLLLGRKETSQVVHAMAEDSHHNIWLGGQAPEDPTRGALWKIDQNLRLHRVLLNAVLDHGFVSSVASDLAGGVWIGVFDGHFYHIDGGGLHAVAKLGPTNNIRAEILPVGPGEAWFLTTRGAEWLKDGRVRVLDTQDGLPCAGLFGLASGKAGDLWLASQCGLLDISAADLGRWRSRDGYLIRPRVFGSSTGYYGDAQSRLIRSGTGALWFATGGGVYEVDPAHLAPNPLSPPVQLQTIRADRRTFPLAARVVLPSLMRDLEIDYAGLSYLQPDLLRFRYRLFGHDRAWNDVGPRRQAFYNDLAPGTYRFQVTACNKDAVCNRKGASIVIVVPPAWWQGWTFRTACLLAVLALIAGAVRWRMTAFARQMRVRFDDRMQERTRVARDLHDTLMQTVLASKMLAEDSQTIGSVPEGVAAFARLAGWLGRASEEGRKAVDALRASMPEDSNLAQCLEMAAVEARGDRPIDTPVLVTGPVRAIHPIVQEEVYRIGVEAVRNACTHSGASHVIVALDYAGQLTLRVSDDGRGIDQQVLERGRQGHFGLVGMRERAKHVGAVFTMESSCQGTTVMLTVPAAVAFDGAALRWPGRGRLRPRIRAN